MSPSWQAVTWREGTNEALSRRFAALRVRPAHRDYLATEMRAEEWLLIEWPQGEKEPVKYFLSTAGRKACRRNVLSSTEARLRHSKRGGRKRQNCLSNEFTNRRNLTDRGRVVVQHDADGGALRIVFVQALEQCDELHTAVPVLNVGEDLARVQIDARQNRHRAMKNATFGWRFAL